MRDFRDHAEHGFGYVGGLGDRLCLVRRELGISGGDGFCAGLSSRVRVTTVVVRPRLVVVIIGRPLAARPTVAWWAAAVARRRPLPLGCGLTAVWIRARLSTLARARRSGRLGPLLAAWPLRLGPPFAGVFLPPVFLFLPRASLYFLLPIVLSTLRAPDARVFVLDPLVVLPFGVLGGLRLVSLASLLLGALCYLRVVRSVPLAVLLLSFHYAPTFGFAPLVLRLRGSDLARLQFTSRGGFVLGPRGWDGAVLVGAWASSRTGRRSPVDLVACRQPPSLS